MACTKLVAMQYQHAATCAHAGLTSFLVFVSYLYLGFEFSLKCFFMTFKMTILLVLHTTT